MNDLRLLQQIVGSLLLMLVGCGAPPATEVILVSCSNGTEGLVPDKDGDGIPAYDLCSGTKANFDCDDDDSNVAYASYVVFWDNDGDGYGNEAVSGSTCSDIVGFVGIGGDWDDDNSSIYPGAQELCDGEDNDQDTVVDDVSANEPGATVFYPDNDEDSYPADLNEVNARWVCLNFEDAPPKETSTHLESAFLDCDDNNKAVNPGAGEICNHLDDDCDSQSDEGGPYYPDTDGDGVPGSAGAVKTCQYGTTAYYAAPSDGLFDCQDSNKAIYPGQTEQCATTYDDNCDGKANNEEGPDSDSSPLAGSQSFYPDIDADGFGDVNQAPVKWCSPPPQGFVTNSDDCDDLNGGINPSVSETCNGIDDNCANGIDEGVKATFYRDNDADGYGDPATTTQACTAPTGYVDNEQDCNDKDKNIYPGAFEVCDGIDNDCNGAIDDGAQKTYYFDFDGDGYGACTVTLVACAPPAGYVEKCGDCQTSDPGIYPGAAEICDSKDNDCDGAVDDGLGNIKYYIDSDGDGYCGNTQTTSCQSSPPAGMCTTSTDCDDTNKAIYQGAPEVCDGKDGDCDGKQDIAEGYDADGDGHLNSMLCSTGDDCDDNDNTTYGGAPEKCDLNDNDCDGKTDEDFDYDKDGYLDATACSALANGTDCNDQDASIHPGATEICDGKDQDCDGQKDEGVTITVYDDKDGDGHGLYSSAAGQVCTVSVGYSLDQKDCDDSRSTVYEGAAEVCNDGQVNDCVKRVDYGTNAWKNTADDPCTLRGELSLNTLLSNSTYRRVLRVTGETSSSGLGLAVAYSGDVDADGNDDVLLGSPYLDNGSSNKEAGAAYGVLGTTFSSKTSFPDGGHSKALSSTLYRVRLRGGAGGAHLGFATSGAGPMLEGDTTPELLIGAPDTFSKQGVAWVVSGKATGEVTLPTSGKNTTPLAYGLAGSGPGATAAGWSVSYNRAKGVGETSYFLVSAPWGDVTSPVRTDSGKVYLITQSSLATAIDLNSYSLDSAFHMLLRGEKDNAHLGMGLGVPGLLYTNDGQTDLVLGAPEWMDNSTSPTSAGRIYMLDDPASKTAGTVMDVTQSSTEFTVSGPATNLGIGYSTAAHGDLNGDGMDDLAFGAYRQDVGSTGNPGEGAVYIFKGGLSGNKAYSAATVSISGGDLLVSSFGYNLASGGDLNCDGYDDLVVGAPTYATSSQADLGAVYIFYGSAQGLGNGASALDLLDADVTLTGQPGDLAGVSLAVDGDLDFTGVGGKQCDDLLIGAPGMLREDTAPGQGVVYVVFGRTY